MNKAILFVAATSLGAGVFGALENGASFGLGEVPAVLEAERPVGEPVQFKLAANPTTGFLWEAKWDAALCDTTLAYRAPQTTACGTPGQTEVTVTSKTNAPVSVELVYRRPWEKETPPFKTVRLTLRPAPAVQKPAAAPEKPAAPVAQPTA